MKIDRHNYEEYFILYLDNELGSEDRRMVEDFVQLHPDLREELDLLLQYKLVPDTHIVFEGKEELLKQNGQPLITAANYEEWFSLYIDRELTPEQEQLVNSFIESHPETAQALTLLQRAKLQPEPLVFAGKASLYRKEEKVRRLFPARWRAAAAVLLLLLGTATVLLLNKSKTPDDSSVVAKKQPGQDGTTVPTPQPGNILPRPAEAQTATALAAENRQSPVTAPLATGTEPDRRLQTSTAAVPAGSNPSSLAENKVKVPVNKTHNPQPAVPANETAVLADNNPQPSNNLPQPLNNPNLSNGTKAENAMAYTRPAESTNNNSSDAVVTNTNTQPSPIIQAGYTETLEQPDGKKNKNRGFFRKIARTFEKRTNIDPTDDNRLLVAGLSIKLK